MNKMTTVTVAAVVLLALGLAGCGETINGIGEDASRMWRGGKMIFISED